MLDDLPSKMIDGQPWVPLFAAQAIVAELQTKLQAQIATLQADLNGWREESRKMTEDNLRLCDENADLRATAELVERALVYRLCMRLWRQSFRNQPELFQEMDAQPVIGDLVFVDFVPTKTDPATCFGILREVGRYGDYVLELADGTLQRWSNVGLHRMPRAERDERLAAVSPNTAPGPTRAPRSGRG